MTKCYVELKELLGFVSAVVNFLVTVNGREGESLDFNKRLLVCIWAGHL